jgi:hypothetical protein
MKRKIQILKNALADKLQLRRLLLHGGRNFQNSYLNL